MSDTVFRSAPPPAVTAPVAIPEPTEPNQVGPESSLGNEEPLEGATAAQAVLAALGIDDATGIPTADQANLEGATEYILALVKQRGATPTESTIKRALDALKAELELDPQAEPTAILDRIGGLVASWKHLAFVKDAGERRRLFMRLARQSDSKAMDREVSRIMEEKAVWR